MGCDYLGSHKILGVLNDAALVLGSKVLLCPILWRFLISVWQLRPKLITMAHKQQKTITLTIDILTPKENSVLNIASFSDL
jgi:hypothetical protein